MKPGRVLLAMAVLTASLHAGDQQWVSVKSNSIQNGALMVSADLQGKTTELFCETKLPSCSQPEPGEYYSMQPATLGGESLLCVWRSFLHGVFAPTGVYALDSCKA